MLTSALILDIKLLPLSVTVDNPRESEKIPVEGLGSCKDAHREQLVGYLFLPNVENFQFLYPGH